MQSNILLNLIILVAAVSAVPAPISAPAPFPGLLSDIDAETALQHLSLKKAAGCSLLGELSSTVTATLNTANDPKDVPLRSLLLLSPVLQPSQRRESMSSRILAALRKLFVMELMRRVS